MHVSYMYYTENPWLSSRNLLRRDKTASTVDFFSSILISAKYRECCFSISVISACRIGLIFDSYAREIFLVLTKVQTNQTLHGTVVLKAHGYAQCILLLNV